MSARHAAAAAAAVASVVVLLVAARDLAGWQIVMSMSVGLLCGGGYYVVAPRWVAWRERRETEARLRDACRRLLDQAAPGWVQAGETLRSLEMTAAAADALRSELAVIDGEGDGRG